MKAVKIILGVLILLLAIISAVFSYFLYEKRVQFVDGWQQLAQAIHDSSAEMDSASETSVAADLDPAKKISHEQYVTLEEPLRKFSEQTKELVKQRDDMAKMLYLIGQTVKLAKGGNEAGYQSIGKYNNLINAVNGAVNDLIERRDSIYSRLAGIAGQYGVTLQKDALEAGKTATLDPLEDFMKEERKQKDLYRSKLSTLACRVDSTVTVSDSDSESVEKAVTCVNKKLDEISEIEEGKRLAEEKNKKFEDDLQEKDREISKLKNDLANEKQILRSFKKEHGVPDDFVLWKAGSDEARSKAEGEVIKVSEDYGYFVVNLGAASVVEQQGGDVKFPIPLKLEAGLEYSVVRDGELITTVKLDRVGDTESTANIPAGITIEEGDKLVFKK